MNITIDLFLDLSQCTDAEIARRTIETIASADGLNPLTTAATVVVANDVEIPDGVQSWRSLPAERAIAAANAAMLNAGREGRDLLVLLGPLAPGNEAVATLIHLLGRDALFGFALPRVATPDGAGIRKLDDELGDPEISAISRAALCALPETYIVPDCLGPCFLVKACLLANLGGLDPGYTTLAGAFQHFICRARRIGYRCLVVNRAVVPAPARQEANAAMPDPHDVWRTLNNYPDLGRARDEMIRLPLHAHESFLGRATSSGKLRNTLLIDARGMGDCFNGTSHCMLGLADGLGGGSHEWQLTFLVKPEAAAFHRLSERYPRSQITYQPDSARYTAALRVSQPWALSTMLELHRQALFNFYTVLDTIAWDILFEAPEGIDATWRFLAEYADGLLYISDFTGQRFRNHFPLSPS